MKAYVITCTLHPAPSSQKRGTWARVFVYAESEDDAVLKLKSQVQSEEYSFRDLESIKLIADTAEQGIKNHFEQASKKAAEVVPFDRSFFSL